MTASFHLIRDYRHCPESARGAAVAIGNFDGLHAGHRRVLDTLVLPGPVEGTAKGREIAADSVPPYPSFGSPVTEAELKLWREIGDRDRSLKSAAGPLQVEERRPVSY